MHITNQNFEWVTAVLQDLHAFTEANSLPKTAAKLLQACSEMSVELSMECDIEGCSNCSCQNHIASSSCQVVKFPTVLRS